MCDPIAYVRALDSAARANPDTPEYNEIQFFPQREDALSLVPVIFQHSQAQIVLFAGARALDYTVKNKWEMMSPEERHGFRASVLSLFGSLPPGHCCTMIIQKVIVSIAIREFPEVWPNFFEFVFAAGAGRFLMLADFLQDLKNGQEMTADHAARVREAIIQALPVLVSQILPQFGEDGSVNALMDLMPYMSTEMLKGIASSQIFAQGPDGALRCLCEIALSANVSKELVMHVLTMIVRMMQDDDSVDDVQISAIVMQNLDVLETPGMVEILFVFHQRLLEAPLSDTAEYWEFLLLSLYASAKSGNTQRVQLHSNIFQPLLMKLMGAYAKPSDFVLKQSGSNFESAGVPYEQERAMLLYMLGLSPDLVGQGISAIFEQLIREFDGASFAKVCWCVGSVAASDSIDANFAMQSMQFVHAVYQSFRLDACVVACFLYLATHFIRCGKITNEMAAVAAGMAGEGLEIEVIQHMCLQYLVAASSAMPDVVADVLIPEKVLTVNPSVLPTDGFIDIAEATARCCLPKGQGSAVLSVVASRWENLRHAASSFDSTRQLQAVLCELIGIARVDPVCIGSVMMEIMPQLQETTKNFHGVLVELMQTIGPKARSRDDVRLMLGFVRHEMQLFREMKYYACDWLISAHGVLPLEMRTPEILSLCEQMIVDGATPPVMNLIREAVIGPTELFTSELENVTMLPEHASYLVKLLFKLAQSHPEYLVEEDILALVHLEKIANPHIYLWCIRGLMMICSGCEHFSPELRSIFIARCLPQIISVTVNLAGEQSHRASFWELIELAYTTTGMILSPVTQSVQLFSDVDNVTGMINLLMADMAYSPLLAIEDVRGICASLFTERDRDKFEMNMVTLASKQTTVKETMQQLTSQKIKAALDAEIGK